MQVISIKKISIRSKIIDYIYIFMYVFAFPTIGIFDSSKIVGIIMLIKFMIYPKYRVQVQRLLKIRSNVYIYVIFYITLVWALIIQFINKTVDFSFLKTFFNLFITLIIGFFLIAYLYNKGKGTKLINYLIVVYIAQTIIQWICFLNPQVYEITSIFRTDTLTRLHSVYSGIRGLTISSTGFFGMASAYGLILVLYMSDYNTLFKNNIIKVFVYFFLVSGVFFTGRTGYIGVGISLLYFCTKQTKSKKIKLSTLFIPALVIVLLIGAVLLMRYTGEKEEFSNLYKYTFEPFENFINGKGFSATSLDSLRDMYVDVEGKTFLIGDGKYTDGGRYYRNTDVGYIRAILYFGIPGLLLLFYLQIKLFNSKKNKMFYFLMFYFMILELKGEIVGFSIIIQSSLIFYSYCLKGNK